MSKFKIKTHFRCLLPYQQPLLLLVFPMLKQKHLPHHQNPTISLVLIKKWVSSAFLAIRLKLLMEKKRLIRSAHLVTVIWMH